MPRIQIIACNVSDGPAIGASNIAAFWTDPTWVRMWPGKTREYVASQASRRMSHRLLVDREHKRHLKAVDTLTGEIVGYACWTLPTDAAEGMWVEAQVPEVGQEVYEAMEKEFRDADWEFDRALDVLDPPMLDMKARWTQGRKYIRQSAPNESFEVRTGQLSCFSPRLSCCNTPIPRPGNWLDARRKGAA